MRIVYTVKPVEGRWPEHPRQAKESLVAMIEESLIPKNLVISYTIANSREFQYPYSKPNPLEMGGFFGEKPDYNAVAKEISELFEQPKREISEFATKLEADLESASNEQVLGMLEKFHYAPVGVKARYEEAVAKIRELWKPYSEIKDDIEASDYNDTRTMLLEALSILDNSFAKEVLSDLKETERLLRFLYRGEAVKRVKSSFVQWQRKNLAPLYHACSDAMHYGEGFWMARLVVPEEEVSVKNYGLEDNPKRAEVLLKWKEYPFQIVEL